MGDNKAQALEAKAQGNAAYKARKFEEAVGHYEQAIALDPTDITFLSNLAAVRFEQKKYQECVEACEKAVDVGRDNRADFKLIAKAMARMGNAYRRLDVLDKAKWAYEKALTEHRTPEYRTSLSEVVSNTEGFLF